MSHAVLLGLLYEVNDRYMYFFIMLMLVSLMTIRQVLG